MHIIKVNGIKFALPSALNVENFVSMTRCTISKIPDLKKNLNDTGTEYESMNYCRRNIGAVGNSNLTIECINYISFTIPDIYINLHNNIKH